MNFVAGAAEVLKLGATQVKYCDPTNAPEVQPGLFGADRFLANDEGLSCIDRQAVEIGRSGGCGTVIPRIARQIDGRGARVV